MKYELFLSFVNLGQFLINLKEKNRLENLHYRSDELVLDAITHPRFMRTQVE